MPATARSAPMPVSERTCSSEKVRSARRSVVSIVPSQHPMKPSGIETIPGFASVQPIGDPSLSGPGHTFGETTINAIELTTPRITPVIAPAARRTTVRVLGLLGIFYLFPGLYGALGRVLLPDLYVTGQTDLVVLRLPEAAWPGLAGEALAAVIAAGAFAAFMSTASGLLVSLAGTTSFDFWGRIRRRPEPGRLAPFRIAAVLSMLVPAWLALLTRELDISVLVSWAFALAASTFCPMLLLGIWWTRLTARATAVGMIAGTLTATGAIVAALVAGSDANGTVLAQPAVFSVPIAFAAMIAISLAERPAPGVEVHMRALHAPEGLGLEAPLAHQTR
jgi:cation/acetate symporter